MASAANTVWAIDVGTNSLKAIKLRPGAEGLEVIELDYLEHGRILSSGSITEEKKTQIITKTLHKFAERHDFSDSEVAISVPGQISFARFVKLPPVDPKRINEIIRFEAVQQIPFDINEVEWDWQLMEKPDSPETEVGIFAIKNELIAAFLENFSNEGLKVSCVQMSPIALYNYIYYDRDGLDEADAKATIVMDMGAENTDLVVCTHSSMWQRTVPIGGNAFTKAVAETFKLDFKKAEKLKRTAPMSKYARQIIHAMRPVFTDFGREIQHSLGFYSSSHHDTKFEQVIALGGGFKMQGLAKFLQQTLQLPIIKPDSFKHLSAGAEVSGAKLGENIADFGVVYGLGIQAVAEAKIQSNLLPKKIARAMTWEQKARYFTIAAAMLLVVTLIAFARTKLDKSKFDANRTKRDEIGTIITRSQNAQQNLSQQERRGPVFEKQIENQLDIFKYRNVVAQLHETLVSILPNAQNNPSQADLYDAFENGDIDTIKQTPRSQRKQLFVTSIDVTYAGDLSKQKFGTTRATRSRTSAQDTQTMGLGAMDPMAMRMQMGGAMPGAMPGRSTAANKKRGRSAKKDAKQYDEAPGFIVVLEGYSPYENLEDLLEPVGVGSDQTRWGLITRLINLEKDDPNGPFKLFSRDNEHFKLEIGVVEASKLGRPGGSMMPEGIGVVQMKLAKELEKAPATGNVLRRVATGSRGTGTLVRSAEKVLIDPMTQEEISKAFLEYDKYDEPVYIERDHWFRINAKLTWKDAPKDTTPKPAAGRKSGRPQRAPNRKPIR